MKNKKINLENKEDKQNLRKQAEAIIDSQDSQLSHNLKNLSLNDTQKIIHELEVHQIELELQNEELLHTQLELENAEKHYYDLFNLSPLGHITLNEAGIIIEANLATLVLLSTHHNTLIKQPITKFIFKDAQDEYYKFHKKYLKSNVQESCELQMKSGNDVIWVHATAKLQSNSDEKSIFHLILTDITKRKEIQKDLEHKNELLVYQSRHAALGEMLGMIAHQWRQPLSSIAACSINLRVGIELEKYDLYTKEGQEDFMKFFIKGLDNVQAITATLSQTITDFMEFYKPKTIIQVLGINNAIKKTLDIIEQSLISNNIEVIKNYNSSNQIKLLENEFMQVVLNILQNAKDTFLENKTKNPKIVISTYDSSNEVIVTIQDNGGGIDEKIINNIFDPYFSTKDEKNGVGLGLYMSKIIIEQDHHGTLDVKNLDDGACFTIKINKSRENNSSL